MTFYLLAINNQTFLKNGFNFDLEPEGIEITWDITQAQVFDTLKDVNKVIDLYGGQAVRFEEVEE